MLFLFVLSLLVSPFLFAAVDWWCGGLADPPLLSVLGVAVGVYLDKLVVVVELKFILLFEISYGCCSDKSCCCCLS